jgi:mono/diheme cytochrome c family protein
VHRHTSLIVIVILAVIVIAIVYAVLTLDISALHEPGPVETRIATTARDWYINKAAGREPSKPLREDASAVSAGEGLFGMSCASCHGKDGRSPTNMGKAMYPRVLDLGSPGVQKLSNRELFWVIKNGVRLSGMPGFGDILSDDEIWQATYYVRSLGKSPSH